MVRKNSGTPGQTRALKEQQLRLLKKREALQFGLPHLYGYKWYSWAWNFFQSTNKMNLICAANQISKSSTQIRKCIDWATDKKKWPTLWPKSQPRQFWYLYPSKDVATVEFEKKWKPEFLPRGEYKDHAEFGWREEFDNKKIVAIHFNSGVSVYFKTYAQEVSRLQTGSVHAIFCDEELPVELIDELQMRISAANIDGYFHMVFTATLNQEYWRLAMEPKDKEKENYPDAFKQQIAMYDCMIYKDGTPGPWTDELINQAKARCKSEAEIQRRVYGKFVTEGGRTYHAYDSDRHFIKPITLSPLEYKFYSAIDNGSGGTAHPAAITFLAVRNDFKRGYFFRVWRGDDVTTTAGDVIEKWVNLRGNLILSQSWYDHQAKDLGTIAERQGENLEKAEKSHDLGEDAMNTLFKNDMLFIFDDESGEGAKLSGELTALMKSTPKNKAKDDLCDAARYNVVNIPWDWASITLSASEKPFTIESRPLTELEMIADQIAARRGEAPGKPREGWEDMEDDFNEWNEAYEG